LEQSPIAIEQSKQLVEASCFDFLTLASGHFLLLFSSIYYGCFLFLSFLVFMGKMLLFKGPKPGAVAQMGGTL
jgi:hypothetical protein